MRLLLDTHIFLWFTTGDGKLNSRWVSTIRDPGNQIFLSVATVWECTVKYGTGKLALPEPPERFFR